MSAEDNRALIERFYKAFAARDGETMAQCYQADATFRDPVFELEGAAIGDMWRMLTSRAHDLEIRYRDIIADENSGSAHWEAWYTFSATKRKVHNIIDARFQFGPSGIAQHVDEFDFWRWSKMALGPVGLLLGWTPMLHNKVRAQAAAGLAVYTASKRGS